MKTMHHMSQSILSGEFRQFDYGSKEQNMKVYNSSEPPDYNFKKIQVPISLFYAEDDLFASVKVSKKLLIKVLFGVPVSRVWSDAGIAARVVSSRGTWVRFPRGAFFLFFHEK